MDQNENFKKFIKNTADKKIVNRLKIAVKANTPISSEDKRSLVLCTSCMGYTLPGLVKLDLSYAKLTSISTMPIMENLVILNLSHNEITSLDGFCQPVENIREVYKFPRLKNLDLSHNSIDLTEESDEKRFNKYFAALRYLDISSNQLESVPMMNTKWFEPNQKNPQYLNICCNNIPIKNLHKLYNWEFGRADSREEWNRKLPPCNSLKIYQQDQNGRICCQMYGQKEDMFLPSNKFAEFEWGNSKETIPDKEYFILSIASLNQDYLNTNFLRVMPQREKK